jgi:hypothetical protein
MVVYFGIGFGKLAGPPSIIRLSNGVVDVSRKNSIVRVSGQTARVGYWSLREVNNVLKRLR